MSNWLLDQGSCMKFLSTRTHGYDYPQHTKRRRRLFTHPDPFKRGMGKSYETRQLLSPFTRLWRYSVGSGSGKYSVAIAGKLFNNHFRIRYLED